jgi:hypothetical protein
MKQISDKVENVGHHVIRLENELKTDVKALFGGYKQTYEKLEVLEIKVDSISQKIEKQDIELKVLKGGK